MADRVVRVGIIGCGGIANGKHLPSLHKLPNVQIVAFCDIVEAKAAAAAKAYGVPGAAVCTDYRELLKDGSIEAVHVLTPNREHAEITIAALNAGKHVMCEKPMAKTAEEARRMEAAAEVSGRKLCIGYQHRYKPQSRYAKDYIATGAMGNIYYANCYALRRRGTPNWGVFLNEEEQGGGPVIDIATHSLDLTLYLMGNYEPRVVLGKTHKRLENPADGNIWGDSGVSSTPMEEAGCAMIVMKNGATILLETSWALNIADPICEGSCRLCGSKAGLEIRNDKLQINKVELGRQVVTDVDVSVGGVAFFAGDSETPSEREAKEWIASIVNDTEPRVTPRQARVVSEILEGIYVSGRTGEPVYFS